MYIAKRGVMSVLNVLKKLQNDVRHIYRYVYMLNGQSVHKLVIQFVFFFGPLSIIQSEVGQFRNQAELFESWLNGLETG